MSTRIGYPARRGRTSGSSRGGGPESHRPHQYLSRYHHATTELDIARDIRCESRLLVGDRSSRCHTRFWRGGRGSKPRPTDYVDTAAARRWVVRSCHPARAAPVGRRAARRPATPGTSRPQPRPIASRPRRPRCRSRWRRVGRLGVNLPARQRGGCRRRVGVVELDVDVALLHAAVVGDVAVGGLTVGDRARAQRGHLVDLLVVHQ